MPKKKSRLNAGAKLWLKALRSGKYKQGRGYLNKDSTCCCLGVLCEVFIEAGGKLTKKDVDGVIFYGGRTAKSRNECSLPEAVRKWVGLHDTSGSLRDEADDGGVIKINQTYYGDLTQINDGPTKLLGLKRIADLIEKHQDLLFIAPK